MNVPKEIINEIAELVQPKHKCIRVEYTYIERNFNDNENEYNGFTVTNGKKILILNYETDFNRSNLIEFILTNPNKDEIPCKNWKEERQLTELISGELNKKIKKGNHMDLPSHLGVYDSYIEYRVVERF